MHELGPADCAAHRAQRGDIGQQCVPALASLERNGGKLARTGPARGSKQTGDGVRPFGVRFARTVLRRARVRQLPECVSEEA